MSTFIVKAFLRLLLFIPDSHIALIDCSGINIQKSGQKEFSVIQKMIYLRSWNNYLDASG
jgi:hypothetical protein